MFEKKNRKYIIRMTIYIIIIIIALASAVIGRRLIDKVSERNVKNAVDQIMVEIEKDGSDLDQCKSDLLNMYGYNADDYVDMGFKACIDEGRYREVKEWIDNNQSWNNGRILIQLCKMPYYKDSFELLNKQFRKMKKNKNSNIDPYKIIYDAANDYYNNGDYNESSDLYSLLGNYKDSKEKYIAGRKELMNQN